MPHDPVAQNELDSIQVEYINLSCIEYRWSAPQYPEDRRRKVNGMYDDWSIFLRKLTNRNTAEGRNKRVTSVYNHIAKHGMKNPFIVKPHSYAEGWAKNKYYTVVGNQRLAIFRAFANDEHPENRMLFLKNALRHSGQSLVELNETGRVLIPCFVAREKDNWEDHTFAVRKYVKFDPTKEGWK